jgi:hypothetical protein
MQRILDIVIDESMEEFAEMDQEFAAWWMHNMACVIEWVSRGDLSVLPDELLGFACSVEGIDEATLREMRRKAEEDDSEPVDAEIVVESDSEPANDRALMVGPSERQAT